MSESREKHRLRMQLQRSHPDWTSEQIRNELQKFTGSQGSQTVHKSSQRIPGSSNSAPSPKGSQEVHRGSHKEKEQEIEGLIVYNQEKGQIGYKIMTSDGRYAIMPSIRQGERIRLNGWYTFKWVRKELKEEISQ